MTAGAPILPVSIEGTRIALPSGGRRVHDGAAVSVVVHAPIETAGLAPEADEELMARVRSEIASGLARP
jgi:hypothetical protein